MPEGDERGEKEVRGRMLIRSEQDPEMGARGLCKQAGRKKCLMPSGRGGRRGAKNEKTGFFPNRFHFTCRGSSTNSLWGWRAGKGPTVPLNHGKDRGTDMGETTGGD